jgi:SAM-dependent methyltransferase
MCNGVELTQFLDLGFTPPADQFLRKEQLREPEIYYPLPVVICSGCGLVQLGHVVSPEILYRRDYPYESSITRTGRNHWSEFANTTVKSLGLGSNDLVVDIGSNVGTLLEAFRAAGTRILGVDPASNIVRIAEKRGVETINEFFSEDVARRIASEHGKAATITGTNVYAHVDDLAAFMRAIDILLTPGGVFIFEAPYLVNLINHLEYDTIYHEHLSYLSVKPLIAFVQRFEMEVFDIQERDIHGGSFRVFISRKGKMPISPVVAEFLTREEKLGLYDLGQLQKFSAAVSQNREDLTWLLKSLKHEGKRICAVSAPAKGMTLLNYCRIGTDTLDFVTEKSTLKIGRFTPGAHIPVVPDDELLQQNPDYALLLAWNFAEELMENLKDYRQRGGKFIIPIPHPRIVD